MNLQRNLLAAKALLRKFEGLRLKAYICPAGVPSIGYGQTVGIKLGMVWTLEYAESDLEKTVREYEKWLYTIVRPDTTEAQLSGLLALAYNIGKTAFKNSTVFKRHQAYAPSDLMKEAFLMWVKARVKGVKQTLPGLVARREAEFSVYSTGK